MAPVHVSSLVRDQCHTLLDSYIPRFTASSTVSHYIKYDASPSNSLDTGTCDGYRGVSCCYHSISLIKHLRSGCRKFRNEKILNNS